MDKKKFEALPKREQLKMVYDVLATFAKEHPGAQGELMKVVANALAKRKKRGKLDVTVASQFFESRFENDMALTPLEVAVTYLRESKISTVMRPAYLLVARQAKNTVIVRNRRLAAKGLGPRVETKTENREISPSIEPKDSDLPPSVRVRKKTRKTPSYREDYRALIESKHSIGDVKQIVNEYSAVWRNTRLARPIELLLGKLADNADWPSMVAPDAEGDLDLREVNRYDRKIYEVLESVSLLDHTYNVLVEAMRILRNHGYEGRAIETYGASVITACLAHDLGVADSIRAKAEERNIDHAVISEWVIRAIFNELFPAGVESANIDPIRKPLLRAIANHHMRKSDDESLVTTILRNADMAARNYEVTTRNRSLHSPSSWNEWFVPEELLAIIEPVVNVLNIRKTNWFQAFNKGNTIYVTKDCLYRAVRKLAKSKDIFDSALVRSSEEINTLTEAANRLKAEGMIRKEDLAEGRWSNYYGITMKAYNGSPIDHARMYLIPFDLKKFGVELKDLELRKKGLYLADIRDVVPSNKKTTEV